jgi:soluble lytic murein transglycosylase
MKRSASIAGRLFCLAGALLALGFAVSPAPTFAADDSSADDASFMAARDALRNGEPMRLARALDALPATYPLRVWAEYWQLRQQLEQDDTAGIPAFLATNEGSYLAEKLRADWLRYMGKHADWANFRREFGWLAQVQSQANGAVQGQADDELDCYAMQAGSAIQDQAAGAVPVQAEVISPLSLLPLWRSGDDMPSACGVVVDQLVANGDLTQEDVWQRVRRLLKAGKVSAGRTLAAKYLPAGEGFGDSRPEIVAADPLPYFKRLPQNFAATRSGRETALLALQTLTKKDMQAAASQLAEIESRLPQEDRGYAWGHLARQAAWRHQPEALAWYAKAADAPLDDDQQAWRVRAALRAQDWAQVQQAIAAMPMALQQQPAWIYWQGRALAALGKTENAQALFLQIAGQPDFYGNLADDALGRKASLPPQAAAPTLAEMTAARNNPGLQRALELFRLGMRVEGAREWNWSLRGMDDRALLAAADLARRHEVWDRAINTANRTQTQHDYSLRYLAPFRNQVKPVVQELGLDPGWVYGLMRQESRFVMNANSAVGAQGLMQVMPATATWVAKKIRLADYHPRKISEMETNIQLGANYLKLVLDSLDDQPVLASAAYNAGPGRARRWRGGQPLEGAIYVETIPFAETRDYVKKVMSNALYYNLLFGGAPQPLQTRLGVVAARNSDVAAKLSVKLP